MKILLLTIAVVAVAVVLLLCGRQIISFGHHASRHNKKPT